MKRYMVTQGDETVLETNDRTEAIEMRDGDDGATAWEVDARGNMTEIPRSAADRAARLKYGIDRN